MPSDPSEPLRREFAGGMRGRREPVMNVVQLILHGLFAMALLGSLGHKLVAAWWPARPPA